MRQGLECGTMDDDKGVDMLRMALTAALLVSSSGAYALNNNDLIRLNQQVARQQAQQQPEVEEMLRPVQQAELRHRDSVQEQVWRQQRKLFSRERYLQEVILEQQRRKDARRLGEDRLRDLLMQREQAPLFP
ncbi:hypothetical protein FO488_03560 [Geobacter sp. FeAm09]|uniref:hypothetical protein n=1 Tax=Geobacter sp. FeAm09 TaxID=2597769 RepID=UPI0011EC8D83|nr:hypothetical protein [Geobacter sp. FeAm09]QEM67319.1 hypothetical protein FO488_03560 [Geobacter sp. FeAm09]